MQHCVMLNTPIWKDLDEYVHSATQLQPQQLTLYGGVAFVSGDLLDHAGMPRYRPAETTTNDFLRAGRAQLESWLHSLLLAIVWPAVRGGSLSCPNEECALNMSSFFRAVERLLELGCPAHWLSELLHEILKGTLRTSATPPTESPSPLSSARTRSCALSSLDSLSACVLEARSIAALWQQRLSPVLSMAACVVPDVVVRVTLKLQRGNSQFQLHMGSLNIGLLLVNSSVAEVRAQLLKAEASAEVGAARRLTEACPRGSVHLLSVVLWDADHHEATIFLPQEEWFAMSVSLSGWRAAALITDSWNFFTAVSPVCGRTATLD